LLHTDYCFLIFKEFKGELERICSNCIDKDERKT